MSEIKPEDISYEFYAKWFTQPLRGMEELCNALNIAQQHGFTVLKPGELYWVQHGLLSISNKGHVVESRCENYSWYHAVKGHAQQFRELDEAKAYCQSLENQTRKGNV